MSPIAAVHAVTALTMFALLCLELRDPGFRADSFAAGARRRRNWCYLAASLLPIFGVQWASAWLQARLPTLLAPGSLPLALDLLGCTLVAELLTWTLHWVKHRNAWLWRLHFQHHRDEHFSVWMVTHTHALEVMVSGTAMAAALLALGFSPLALQLYLALYSVVLMLHHSARGYRLGPLERVVIGPAYHRLHHGVDAGVNYGGALTLWDRVFGTARWPQAQDRDAPLGLAPTGGEPFGFRAEMLHFLARRREGPP